MNEIILDTYTHEIIIDAVINTASYDDGLSGRTDTSPWNIPLDTIGYASYSGSNCIDLFDGDYGGIPLMTHAGGDY